jgi:hypothetical protein
MIGVVRGMNQVESKPKLTEDERILGTQIELFSLASEEDLKDALTLLKSFTELKIRADDFKKHEAEIMETIMENERKRIDDDQLYSDKTPTAVILAMEDKKAYEECNALVKLIERAVGCILDVEARDAVYYRYIKGCSYKETLLFMKRGVKSATVDRRLKTGIDSVANTLKMRNVFDTLKNEGKLRER